MRKGIVTLACAALALLTGPGNFAAQKHYIVTNDDNSNTNANTATLFEVNTETGALQQVRVLYTGGTGVDTGIFVFPRNAIDKSPQCLFVSDTGSSDIASFALPSFTKTGNYSNPGLYGGGEGISLAVSPNGKYLFGAYGDSSNVGVWNVGGDCSLALNGSPYTSGGSPVSIAVTSDGSELVVSLLDAEAVVSYAVGSNGALTAQPALNFANVEGCARSGCLPDGLDITNDGKLVIAGNAYTDGPSSVLTASLSADGLSNPGYHTHLTTTKNPYTVWFSPAAANGHGFLYVGMAGGPNAGVVTVDFNETPLEMKYLSETADPGANIYDNIQTIGTTGTGELVAAAAAEPNYIAVYRVDPKTGALKEISTTPDPQSTGPFLNITAFPLRPVD